LTGYKKYGIVLYSEKYMKKSTKIGLITALIIGVLNFAWPAKAEVVINNITISDFTDGQATFKWQTNVPTAGKIYLGTNPDSLNRITDYRFYDQYHTLTLLGLEEDKTYYYKIVAFNFAQEAAEIFVQSFSTKDMLDTQAPKVSEEKILQNTGDAVFFSWHTNENTKATIYYGSDLEKMTKSASDGRLIKDHEYVIRGLKNNTKYFLKIVASDKTGNKTIATNTLSFKTGTITSKNVELKIEDLQPLVFDQNLISTDSVTIKFSTNLLTKSYLNYGTEPTKYKEKVTISDNFQSDHQVSLSGLKPNTKYYYKITIQDAIYSKKFTSKEFSFTTLPQQKTITPSVLGTKIINNDVDSDHDGLSDKEELALGTNPTKADTDGDSYADGLEVKNGYNPLGPGKLIKKIYEQTRLDNKMEMARSIELKKTLESKIGKLKLGAKDWFTVVNAYIYGDYPVEAITQAIKYGGKTVHPSISWSLWKNSADYQQYINK
jgi:hypothetical protein